MRGFVLRDVMGKGLNHYMYIDCASCRAPKYINLPKHELHDALWLGALHSRYTNGP